MLAGMEPNKPGRRLPGRREDGAATKQQILEAAGEIFAQKGVGRATGKEIAARAATNSAAVNYYFGGIDGLYAEVLVEAHHRLVDYDFLKKIAQAPGSAQDKLNALIDGAFRAVLGPRTSTWPLRVLGREMLQPSEAFPILLEREILPKKLLATGFVAEILGVTSDHPAVARCLPSILAPLGLLMIGSPQILEQAAPPAAFAEIDTVIRHFQDFVAGGLAAIAAKLDRDGPG